VNPVASKKKKIVVHDALSYNSSNTIWGTLVRVKPTFFTILLDNGYKTSIIFKGWAVKNLNEINFNDGINLQKFVLSDWQMQNIFFFKGRTPPSEEIRKMRREMKSDPGFQYHQMLLDLAEARKYANDIYASILKKSHAESISDLGGYGKAKIIGLQSYRNLTKALKVWMEKNPSFGQMKSDSAQKNFSIVLEFSCPTSTNYSWRLAAYDPKSDATKGFLNFLSGLGYDTRPLRMIKTS
jgi:hypothetical protein